MADGPTRRALITAMGAGTLAGCGPDGGGDETDPAVGAVVVRYGDDPSQFLELTRAESSRGVVVVIHGGFWRSGYDLSLGTPLVPSLVAQGWAVANLEYRRVGNGGGWPATFDDVHAGLEVLAEQELDLGTVITLGHSAGGHLAVWAAGRHRLERWADAAVPVTGAISQAGVLDLRTADLDQLGGGAVAALMGAGLDRLDDADPMTQIPLEAPVRCVHAPDDDIVPISQSRTYVDAAVAAGADATLTEVDGGHFGVIDPGSAAWERILDLVETF